MKIKLIILVVVLLCGELFLVMGRKDTPQQKAAGDSFLGSPPEPSKPYNILDYTKPPPK